MLQVAQYFRGLSIYRGIGTYGPAYLNENYAS